MSELSKRIESLRLELNDNKGEFAKRVGVQPQQYSRYIKGQAPSLEVIMRIANACDVTLAWLQTGEEPKKILEPSNTIKHQNNIGKVIEVKPHVDIPVISLEEAVKLEVSKEGVLLNIVALEEIPTEIDYPGVFAVKIDDDSMNPQMSPDDYLIIDPFMPPEDSDIVLVDIGETKAIIRKYTGDLLIPFNTAGYNIYNFNEINARIIGVVVAKKFFYKRYTASQINKNILK